MHVYIIKFACVRMLNEMQNKYCVNDVHCFVEKMALLAVTGTSGIAQKINVFVSMVNKTGKEIDTKASQIENRYRHFSSLHKLKTYIVIFQACMDGYTGVNCSTPCPDSFYGQGCLLSCSCSIDLCHHVYGCRISQGLL